MNTIERRLAALEAKIRPKSELQRFLETLSDEDLREIIRETDAPLRR